MFAKPETLNRPSLLLIAMGIAILAVLSLKSLDIPVRQGVTGVPVATPVIEDWRGNSGSIPDAPSLPPGSENTGSK